MTNRVSATHARACFLAVLSVGFLLALALSSSCSDGSEGSAEQGLSLSLDVPAAVSLGDVASLKLQLTNSGDKDIAVETGRPAYDFVVTDADGLEVWRAVPESVDVADRQVVDAGETLAFSHDWSLVDMNGSPVPPGVYFVQGLINGHPDMETPTQEIEVAAG